MKSIFEIGEMVGINSNYNAGIWLRPAPDIHVSSDSGHVQHGCLLILEISEAILPADPSVKVIASDGKIGWTFQSRLIKL